MDFIRRLIMGGSRQDHTDDRGASGSSPNERYIEDIQKETPEQKARRLKKIDKIVSNHCNFQKLLIASGIDPEQMRSRRGRDRSSTSSVLVQSSIPGVFVLSSDPDDQYNTDTGDSGDRRMLDSSGRSRSSPSERSAIYHHSHRESSRHVDESSSSSTTCAGAGDFCTSCDGRSVDAESRSAETYSACEPAMSSKPLYKDPSKRQYVGAGDFFSINAAIESADFESDSDVEIPRSSSTTSLHALAMTLKKIASKDQIPREVIEDLLVDQLVERTKANPCMTIAQINEEVTYPMMRLCKYLSEENVLVSGEKKTSDKNVQEPAKLSEKQDGFKQKYTLSTALSVSPDPTPLTEPEDEAKEEFAKSEPESDETITSAPTVEVVSINTESEEREFLHAKESNELKKLSDAVEKFAQKISINDVLRCDSDVNMRLTRKVSMDSAFIKEHYLDKLNPGERSAFVSEFTSEPDIILLNNTQRSRNGSEDGESDRDSDCFNFSDPEMNDRDSDMDDFDYFAELGKDPSASGLLYDLTEPFSLVSSLQPDFSMASKAEADKTKAPESASDSSSGGEQVMRSETASQQHIVNVAVQDPSQEEDLNKKLKEFQKVEDALCSLANVAVQGLKEEETQGMQSPKTEPQHSPSVPQNAPPSSPAEEDQSFEKALPVKSRSILSVTSRSTGRALSPGAHHAERLTIAIDDMCHVQRLVRVCRSVSQAEVPRRPLAFGSPSSRSLPSADMQRRLSPVSSALMRSMTTSKPKPLQKSTHTIPPSKGRFPDYMPEFERSMSPKLPVLRETALSTALAKSQLAAATKTSAMAPSLVGGNPFNLQRSPSKIYSMATQVNRELPSMSQASLLGRKNEEIRVSSFVQSPAMKSKSATSQTQNSPRDVSPDVSKRSSPSRSLSATPVRNLKASVGTGKGLRSGIGASVGTISTASPGPASMQSSTLTLVTPAVSTADLASSYAATPAPSTVEVSVGGHSTGRSASPVSSKTPAVKSPPRPGSPQKKPLTGSPRKPNTPAQGKQAGATPANKNAKVAKPSMIPRRPTPVSSAPKATKAGPAATPKKPAEAASAATGAAKKPTTGPSKAAPAKKPAVTAAAKKTPSTTTAAKKPVATQAGKKPVSGGSGDTKPAVTPGGAKPAKQAGPAGAKAAQTDAGKKTTKPAEATKQPGGGSNATATTAKRQGTGDTGPRGVPPKKPGVKKDAPPTPSGAKNAKR